MRLIKQWLILSIAIVIGVATELVAESKTTFRYDKITGVGHEKGCSRRDPSDIIKVDDKCYIYYTKVYGRFEGYWGTLWYAVSSDNGYSWTEMGEILKVGDRGEFDSQATFTPNIIYAEGQYWLYYTGVKPTPGNRDGEFENNSTTDITALGLAVSDSPAGPFKRVSKSPILRVSSEPEKFDSYRIDDASMLYRNGLYWLYYKGRSRSHGANGPAHTWMGVAYSKSPKGPFIKLDKPLLPNSHEVMIWPKGSGVAALASISSSFEFAPNGVDFMSDKQSVTVENRPHAPGAFRPDLTSPVVAGEGLRWGIGMIHNGDETYLIRFTVEL